jgi:integrase
MNHQNEKGDQMEEPKRGKESPPHRDADGLHKRRGIWYYCLTVKGQRKFFSTRTSNYQKARTIRADAVKLQSEGKLPGDLSKQKFEVALGEVLEGRKPHLAENTIRLEHERSGPLLKLLSGRRVSEIDATAIAIYQAARVKQVSPRTVNLECKVLRLILRAAKVWAPIADDFKPLKEDRHGPGRAITEAEEKLLFDTARSKPGWDAAFFAAMCAANTSARSCELKGLRLSDVNLVNREVTIRKSKTDTGVRRIPLNDGAMWGFARLLERAGALGSVAPEHFLFPRFLYRETKAAGHGTGYDPTRPQKTWRTAWRALTKETARRAGREAASEALEARRGLRAAIAAWKRAAAPLTGMRFHDLRHLAITKLAESEASDQTIMSIAGHMDRAMLEHYSHIRAAAKRKAVDAIRSYVPTEEPVAITKRVQ